MGRFARALESAGVRGLPTMHNLPPGQEATPLNAARIAPVVDLVGLDYYHVANPQQPHDRRPPRRAKLCGARARRLGAAAVRVRDGRGLPALLRAARGARQRLHRDGRARLRAARVQPLHGGRARSLDRRAHRSARPPAPLRRLLAEALRRARARPIHAPRAACAGPHPHAAQRAPPLPRDARLRPASPGPSSPSPAMARARAPRGRISASATRSAMESDSVRARLRGGASTRAASPSPTSAGEDRDISLAGARWIICATSGGLSPELFARPRGGVQAGDADHARPARARASTAASASCRSPTTSQAAPRPRPEPRRRSSRTTPPRPTPRCRAHRRARPADLCVRSRQRVRHAARGRRRHAAGALPAEPRGRGRGGARHRERGSAARDVLDDAQFEARRGARGWRVSLAPCGCWRWSSEGPPPGRCVASLELPGGAEGPSIGRLPRASDGRCNGPDEDEEPKNAREESGAGVDGPDEED